MQLNEVEINNFEKSYFFHICEEGVFNVDDMKNTLFTVRDRCHLPRNFRGAAHNICN